MDELLAYIGANWLEWLFAAATAILAALYRRIAATLKEEQLKHAAVAAGVQALLRESIVSSYNRYQEKGYAPIYAKESIRRVYAAYHDLGGNDVATGLYNKLLAMPDRKEDDDDHDDK